MQQKTNNYNEVPDNNDNKGTAPIHFYFCIVNSICNAVTRIP